MKYAAKYAFLYTLLFGVISCSSNDQVKKQEPFEEKAKFPELNVTNFDLVNVPNREGIFSLSNQHFQAFEAYFYGPENQHLAPHKRLAHYLESRLENFDYLGKTLNAEHALSQLRGNCLSLAILTSALAEHVGIEIGYRKVNVGTVYRRYHNVMTTSSHVQTILYAPKEKPKNKKSILVRGRIIIDYFPASDHVTGGAVSSQDFISMYYQNLASEAIVSKDYNLAYSLLKKAVEFNPFNAETINSLAVLNLKVGEVENAEMLYQFGLKSNNSSINLVSNYAGLLKKQGKEQQALTVLSNIENNQDDNPYSWLDRANAYLDEGNLLLAKVYFNKALKIAPYLHEAHFGLARFYLLKGNKRKALVALEEAKRLTFEEKAQRLYNAKAFTLKAYTE